MAVIVGYAGSVTWAGSTNNAQLASTGGEPINWTLTMNGDEHETTAFAGTGAQTTFVKGLTSWSGTFETTLKTPATGTAGLVTFAGGYVTNLIEWTMDIARDALDATVFGASERAFVPGLARISGTFRGYIDDTTAVTAVANTNEPATGTFKVREAGATDDTLSGSIFTRQLDLATSPAALGTVGYAYRLSGALTQSTPSAGTTILVAGTFDPVADVASTITLAADGTRTYSGSAFWTSIGIRVAVGELVSVRVGFQGTGALTIA